MKALFLGAGYFLLGLTVQAVDGTASGAATVEVAPSVPAPRLAPLLRSSEVLQLAERCATAHRLKISDYYVEPPVYRTQGGAHFWAVNFRPKGELVRSGPSFRVTVDDTTRVAHFVAIRSR